MALASGHWITKEVQGKPPSPRHGHAVAVAGNIAFLFGGVSTVNFLDNQLIYLNDFYVLTVSPTNVTWEEVPQNGDIPTAREGHSLCVVKGKLYLFGGSSYPQSKECLPGTYCFDIVSLTWEKLKTWGMSPRSLKHSSAVVGNSIYVFGGILDGFLSDDLLMFNTVSVTWTPVKTSGLLPSPRFQHKFAVVGELIYLFGGCSHNNSYCRDVYMLNTDTLTWQKCDVKGECPLTCTGFSLTAHHDKDIYLFGGKCTNKTGDVSSTSEVHKLSIAKMKWKVPLYVGIPPERRHDHAAFIIHSHMYVFGGRNEEQEFNDLKVMKLINPSERQPVMKEILSEFGIQGVSNGFSPTKIPNVKYELSNSPSPARLETPSAKITGDGNFTAVRNEAMDMIHRAFAILDAQFQKLDREKSEFAQAVLALQYEKEAFSGHHKQQKQELQEMIERHKAQNESWLRARAEENDKERKALCKLRLKREDRLSLIVSESQWKEYQAYLEAKCVKNFGITFDNELSFKNSIVICKTTCFHLRNTAKEEIMHEQNRLKEEQYTIQKRSEQLHSIMQQFKGM